MKKIDTFDIVATILIIIMMSLPIYFDCKTNSLFLLIPACIMLLLFCMWFRYFSKEIELKWNNMEPVKNINVTLSNAKEWYNSGNKTLKEIAIKAFLENELKPHPYSEIKTFEDAVKALGMNLQLELTIVEDIEKESKASAAMFKLNIVRKALNLEQDLHLTKNPEDSYIYYPYNPFVTKSSTYYKSEINSGKMEVIGKINSKGEEYNVLGDNAYGGYYDGLGCFNSDGGVGAADADVGYLGCANEKIAKHLSKYFGVLITEAKYGDLYSFDVIEDKYGNA